MTTYTFSIATDMPGGVVNPGVLEDEIVASAIALTLDAAAGNVSTEGDVLSISFIGILTTGDETILHGDTTGPAGGLLAAHQSAKVPPETGTSAGDEVLIEDVSGNPGLPAIDGSQVTGLTHGQLGGLGTTDHHSNANDPSAGEKLALAGSSGTPGTGNKYVTDADARNTNARTPTAHATSHKHGGADEVATATPAANSIPKTGGSSTLAVAWLPTLVGDSGAGGTAGIAPAPAAGDFAAGKYLNAGGTYTTPTGGEAGVESGGYAESEGLSSTTALVFQDKVTLTTAALTGVYEITWSGDVGNDSSEPDCSMRMYNITDGIVYSESHGQIRLDTNGPGFNSFAGLKRVTFAGVAKTFAIEYHIAIPKTASPTFVTPVSA